VSGLPSRRALLPHEHHADPWALGTDWLYRGQLRSERRNSNSLRALVRPCWSWVNTNPREKLDFSIVFILAHIFSLLWDKDMRRKVVSIPIISHPTCYELYVMRRVYHTRACPPRPHARACDFTFPSPLSSFSCTHFAAEKVPSSYLISIFPKIAYEPGSFPCPLG